MSRKNAPGASRQIALLRGIDVGRAKRVAMAELRAVVEGLGYGDVRTLRNGGNVLVAAPGIRGTLRGEAERASARRPRRTVSTETVNTL